jgi:phosphopantothenoylcysteine decarboxylase/phosphopantothenate--cysteine ligase
MSTYYVRNPETALMVRADEVLAIQPDGNVVSLQRSGGQVHRLLVCLRNISTIEELAGALGMAEDALSSVLQRLESCKIVVSGDWETVLSVVPLGPVPKRKPICKNVVVGISGTFQVIGSNIIGMVAGLKGTFAEEVHVILTQNATKFVKPEIFSHYGLPVWLTNFETRGQINVPHMALAGLADLVFVMATASTIQKLANGACSDLLSLVVAATEAPVVVAPTMNPLMESHAPVRRNLDRLRADGFYIVEPGLATELSKTHGTQLTFAGMGIPRRGLVALLAAALAAGARTNRVGSDLSHQRLVPPAPAAGPESERKTLRMQTDSRNWGADAG